MCCVLRDVDCDEVQLCCVVRNGACFLRAIASVRDVAWCFMGRVRFDVC